MKRKIVMALLVTMLAAGTFTGCGNKMGGDGKVQAAAAEAGSDQGESVAPEDKPESLESTSTAEGSQADGGATQEDNADSQTGTKEEKEESYTYSEMDNVVMYAKTGVDVRDLPTASGNKVKRLTKGDEVVVTGKCVETGWYRIVVDGKEMYVSSTYITSEKPSTTGTNRTGTGTGSTTRTGTGTTTGQNTGSGTGTGTQTTSSSGVSQEFVNYLNQQRAAAGLQQISWDEGLAAEAQRRAQEIVSNFSHDGAGNYLENILYGPSSSASGWFDQWYNSEGHRLTMMHEYLVTGGCAWVEIDGIYYVVFDCKVDIPVMSTDEWNAAKENGEVNQLESIENGAGWNAYGTDGVEVETDEGLNEDFDAILRDAGLIP